jgi:hypothetical protein
MERMLRGSHPVIVGAHVREGVLLLLQCRPSCSQQRLLLRRLPFGYVLPEELLMLPAQRGIRPHRRDQRSW